MKRESLADFRPFEFNLYGSTKQKETGLKRTSFKADFNWLMDKQKGKCAYSKCAKLHKVKQNVHSIRDLDHIIPIKIWELMKKKGDVNMRSNLQLLCPGCHQYKTAEDRKRIAKYKERTSGSQKREPTIQDMLGNLKSNWKI